MQEPEGHYDCLLQLCGGCVDLHAVLNGGYKIHMHIHSSQCLAGIANSPEVSHKHLIYDK
jgi:hypothetical protein